MVAKGSVEQPLDSSGGFSGKLPVYLGALNGQDPTTATFWECQLYFVDRNGTPDWGFANLKSVNGFIHGSLPQ
jgi:hypothetical protein